MIIREYKGGDIPELKKLWKEVFNDRDEFIDGFFSLLPGIGSGVVAEEGGKLLGAAYAVCGQHICSQDEKEGHVCGYIYGLAVKPEERGKGLGKALSTAARDMCLEHGADIAALLPAEDWLYAFYEKTLGMHTSLFRKITNIECEDGFEPDSVTEVTGSEYNVCRSKLLEGKEHVHLSGSSAELERLLCKAYGGGFYACGSGICAAYEMDGVLIIPEILCDEADKLETAKSAARHLGLKSIAIYEPGNGNDTPYVISDKPELLKDVIWNLTFD